MKQAQIETLENPDGLLKFSNNQARADYRIKKREIIKKDGTVVKKKTTTVNDEKIADTCHELFQQSELAIKFNYSDLHKQALEELESDFQKYNVIETHTNSSTKNKEIRKKREIAASQWIKRHIEKNVDLSFEFGFDEFVDRTGIKSAQRVGVALKLLDEVQSKSFFEWKEPNVSEDYSEIVYELTKMNVIPTLSLVLDQEMGEKYDTISEFAAANIRNKKKHIKGIKFDISKSYLPNILGLGRDFTLVHKKDRDNFSSSYSFRLETLVRSIEKVQYMTTMNRFTFKEIQSKFGTEFAAYKNFKKRVLLPAINEVNNFTDLYLELEEIRKGNSQKGELEYIRFAIKKKYADDEGKKFGIDATAFYISSRLFYFSSQKIENLLGFAKHIEKTFNSLDLVLYGNKYLAEWKEECEKAVKCEKEIIKLMDAYKRTMKAKGLKYDDKRMCIVEIVHAPVEEGVLETKEAVSIIKTADYKVTNPMESLKYLQRVVDNEVADKVNIFDYVPFKIASLSAKSGWIKIHTLESYKQNEDYIKNMIVQKKDTYFKFEDEVMKDFFVQNMMRENFAQIDKDFREMVRKLSGL